MLHSITSFRGEVPLLAPEDLPPNASAKAVNCRLYSGNLTAFRNFSITEGLFNAGPVRTIYLLNNAWLSWDSVVDVARGIVPGDTTFRTYLTGLDAPRFTTYALATTGAKPYPVTTRLLGVPAPDSPPTFVTSQRTKRVSRLLQTMCAPTSAPVFVAPKYCGVTGPSKTKRRSRKR